MQLLQFLYSKEIIHVSYAIKISPHVYFPDPCDIYKHENDSSRLRSNREPTPKICDRDIMEADWYRLTENNGNDLMLATRCVPLFRCQTLSTGWMNGSHPTGKLNVLLMLILH